MTSKIEVMLQRIRERLTLLLIVLLPFHAFAVTVFTKLIAGPGYAPLTSIALWKEGVLAVMLLIALMEILLAIRDQRSAIRRFDSVDILIVVLLILAFLISDLRSQISPFILGVKYDFIPLIAFIILRRVQWSDWFKDTVVRSILWVASIVSVYGIATLFLPDNFFTWLGYSDLHSLYVANGPLAAFQQIGGSALHRVQSTFSGPNQLGIWLLIPIAIAVTGVTLRPLEGSTPAFLQRVHASSVLSMTRLALFLVALLLTFSRAAWIAAFVIIVIAAYPLLKAHLTRGRLIGSGVVLLALLVAALVVFPQTLLRISSTRGHIDRPIEALQKMIAHPFGLGLGSAGPATNRTGDTCVMLDAGSDPSWAKDRPELCVFVGETQVQPVERTCNCPFLPENWYLQIGVELGLLGLILYVSLIVLVLLRLRRSEIGDWPFEALRPSGPNGRSGVFAMFLGVSIAALFLHAWEDAAVAYTVWVLLVYHRNHTRQV